MTENCEKEPLIGKHDRQEDAAKKKSKQIHIILPIIMILNYVGSQMGSLVTKEYNVQYFKDNQHSNVSTRGHDQSNCGDNNTASHGSSQSESATWMMYFEFAEYIPSLFIVVLGGVYSDVHGRRLFIILPLFGNLMHYTTSTIVVFYNLHVRYILIGYAAAGIFGSHYTLTMAFSAVMADISAYDKSRSFFIALLEVYAGLGEMSAQIGTGYLVTLVGFTIPALVGSSAIFIALVTAFAFMPETLKPHTESNGESCFRFKSFVSFYTNSSNLKNGKVWKYVTCLSSYFFISGTTATLNSIEIIYFMGEPFCFSSESVGWINAVKDLAKRPLATGILKVMHKRFNDDIIAIIGCVSAISSFIVEGMATSSLMLYISAGCGILMLIPSACIRGIVSRMVHETNQGALFANIYAVDNICRLFGSTLFLTIYADTQYLMRGFVFLVYAGFALLSAMLIIPILIFGKEEEQKTFIVQN